MKTASRLPSSAADRGRDTAASRGTAHPVIAVFDAWLTKNSRPSATRNVVHTLRAEVAKALGGQGWRDWSGGLRPTAPDQGVEVALKNGATERGAAVEFDWSARGDASDIIAWRPAGPIKADGGSSTH